MTDNKDRIILYWKKDASGRYFLSPGGKTGRLDGPELEVVIKMSEEETENQMTRTTQTTRTIRAARTKTVVSEDRGSGGNGPEARVFRVFQQKAGTYGAYSEYMTRHGCACCSLTTLLAAYVPQYLDLRPDETIARVEREHFDEKVWQKNYSRHIARQMPVSLYGISRILTDYQVPHRYVGAFADDEAMEEIGAHLRSGRSVVVETSRMKRENGRIVRWFDKRFAGSYHTMILLGEDESGRVIFTDSATREWSGDWQRLKKAELSDLLSYMFPQRNTEDTHVYFSRRRNTGGYILVTVQP